MKKEELMTFLKCWENMTLLFNDRDLAAEHFPMLMEITLTGTDRSSWRASWAADKINETLPGIAAPWIQPMIDALHRLEDRSKKRQYMKFISLYPIPENEVGFLFDYCMGKMTSETEDISVRVYAMQVLYNISELEPGLKEELLETIEREMEYHPTPGILTRGRKLTGRLRKEINKSKTLTPTD
jgi:hypothetical protein